MFNKNLIICLVAVVLLGGGIGFYFLNGSNVADTTTSAPVVRKGELTRELAKQLIMANSEVNDISITGITMQNETTAYVDVAVTVNADLEKTGFAAFTLYDDGWRLSAFKF